MLLVNPLQLTQHPRRVLPDMCRHCDACGRRRLLVIDQQEPPPPAGVAVPAHIWQHSARMLRELKRIHEKHPIDIIEAPIWDAEGIAAILDGSFKVVTSLHTPLKTWIKTNLELVTGTPEEGKFFEQLIAAETLVTERADGLRA